MLPLTDWENFYVIVGSSAAALTGLQFVVIALGAEGKSLSGESAVHAFATPTIVHFCAVLLLAAIISTPGQTAITLMFCFALCGAAGLVYVARVARHAREQTGYTPVLEDWIWHAWLPLLGYASLFTAGVLAYRHPTGALYAVAAIALLLLFIGIHNAWDAAVWMALTRKQGSSGSRG